MIRPASFAYNEETAANNVYQHKPVNADICSIQQQVLIEFDALIKKLKDAGVNVIVVNDTPEPPKPDAIFPNNWISFHEDACLPDRQATVVLYPMYAANRRTERRKDIIELLGKQYGFTFNNVIDLTQYEQKGKFLEGTGSLVFDRVNKVAYSSVSERTSPELVHTLCSQLNYIPHIFHAVDEGVAVYHTNVVMTVCNRFAVICLDYISSETEKAALTNSLRSAGKEILVITPQQVKSFAGNMLGLSSEQGKSLLVMSSQAYNSLRNEQLDFLRQHCSIIHSPLDTIEKYGGGSARCMIAEIFISK